VTKINIKPRSAVSASVPDAAAVRIGAADPVFVLDLGQILSIFQFGKVLEDTETTMEERHDVFQI
jgi:hypothetical protein